MCRKESLRSSQLQGHGPPYAEDVQARGATGGYTQVVGTAVERGFTTLRRLSHLKVISRNFKASRTLAPEVQLVLRHNLAA